jgi:hypothetical protein
MEWPLQQEPPPPPAGPPPPGPRPDPPSAAGGVGSNLTEKQAQAAQVVSSVHYFGNMTLSGGEDQK